MDFPTLRTELLTDPLAFGYSGMTDQSAADTLNATNTGRTKPNTAVPVAQVFNSIVNADWPAAGSASESKLRALLGMQFVDASNTNTKGIIAAVFGAGTQTRTNLTALATLTVSRAVELGLGPVTAGDVNLARGGVW